MKYYAEDILKKDQHIVSVDGTQDKIFEQDYIYTIKDPFDKTHNPARVKNVEQRKILEIFATGFKELKSKDSKIISRMFAMS